MWDEAEKIKSVEEFDTGYNISMENSWSVVLEKKNAHGFVPKEGDKIEIASTNGMGSRIRGMRLNDKEVYYKSDDQLELERIEKWIKIKQDKLDRFKDYMKHADHDYESLDPLLKAEIDDLRKKGIEERIEYEAYAMFTLTQAMEIANTLKTPKAVEEFKTIPYDERKKQVPTLSDDHSGYTFGFACARALSLVQKREKEISSLNFAELLKKHPQNGSFGK